MRMEQPSNYSGVCPVPSKLRGFLFRANRRDKAHPDESDFTIVRYPIYGIVTKTTHFETGTDIELLPVIHDPSWNGEPSGGLVVYTGVDFEDLAFSVIWCWLPEKEDESRFADIEDFLRREAPDAEIRRARRKP